MRTTARTFHRVVGFLGLLLSLAWPALAGKQLWTPTGPYDDWSTVLTTVLSLAFAPSDSRIVYAGLHEGGVAKSDDGGRSWHTVSIGLGNARVRSIAVEPRDPDRVYAGTEGGFFRSADGGQSWQASRPVLPLVIQQIVIDPGHEGALYAGTDMGIFRSFDGGVRWQLLTAGLPDPSGMRVTALAIDPLHTRRLYLAWHEHDHGHLFKTADGGQTWFPLLPPQAWSVPSLAVDPFHDGTVWASNLKSIDGGRTWENSAQRVTAFDPFAPDTLYSFTVSGLYRSDDGGATWRTVGAGLRREGFYTLAADPGVPGRLLAGGSGGVYVSTDHGETWSASSDGLVTSFALVLAMSAAPGALYVGTGSGLYRTLDHGLSWTLIGGGIVSLLAVAPSDPSTLYAAERGGIIQRSTDGGVTWVRLPTPHPVLGLAVDAGDARTIYAAANDNGLYRSTDGGETWTMVYGVASYDVVSDPTVPGTVFALYDNDIVRSVDGGATWRTVFVGAVPPLRAHLLRRLFVAPTVPRSIFAADERALYGTRDGGHTWSLLAHRPFPSALAVDPLDPEVLYLGLSRGASGLEQTTDGGATWGDFDHGLWNRNVTHLIFDPEDPFRLYAATAGGGVFVYDFPH